MAYSSAWGPGAGTARPRYTASDIVALLWRDRFLILGVFILIAAIGVGAALAAPTRYPARASLLVGLGPEYVYQPELGDAARGAIPTSDERVSAEVAILTSQELRRRVIDQLGMAEVFPDRAEAYASAPPATKVQLREAAATAMGANLDVRTSRGSGVVRIAYWDTDPARAATVLNRLLDDDFVYRAPVLEGMSELLLGQELKAFEGQLAQADAAYQAFLSQAGITDFEAEKSSLNSLKASVRAESYRVPASERPAVLARLAQIAARRQRLNELEPRYLDLARSRALLQDDVERLLQRKQEADVEAATVRDLGALRIIERPIPSEAGESLRTPMLALGLLFAAVAAAVVGLARLSLRRGFPSAASAALTLGLPVLAAARYKPGA